MISDISFQEYRRLDRANASTLWRVLASPRHAKWDMDNPTPPSEQMMLGIVFHSLITGKDAPIVRPATANLRSNVGKKNLITWMENVTGHAAPRPLDGLTSTSAKLDSQIQALKPVVVASGIEVVSEDQVDTAEQMRDSLMDNPVARVLFDAGQGEVSCLQIDPETGVDTKARWDWLPDGHRSLVDIKTSRSAIYDNFARSCMTYGYHLQAAWYQWLYELEYGARPAFFFAVVEDSPPFDSAIFEADDDFLEEGRRLFRRALDIYAECKSKNFWPGADWDWDTQEHAIKKLNFPGWVK